ncbi:MAG TPA: hypothetical protein VM011_05825 [Gammaproteobacteria bacterium]|nr:hypothetical protein [Gammaproteobacteria bacterium]
MKIRSLISSTLLAASLGLGINAPAQADHGKFSQRLHDRHDSCPIHNRDRHYGKDTRHRNLKAFWRQHDWRRHDSDGHDRRHDGRGRDYDRHHADRDRDYDRHNDDRQHADRGRDYDRYDDHDRQRRH